LLERRMAGILVIAALASLTFPPQCAAAATCTEVGSASLGEGPGGAAWVRYLPCGNEQRIAVCQGAECDLPTCEPDANTSTDAVLTSPVEGWIDPLLSLRTSSGKRHVLA